MYIFAIGIIILQIGGTFSQIPQGNFKRVLDFSDPGKILLGKYRNIVKTFQVAREYNTAFYFKICFVNNTTFLTISVYRVASCNS